MREYKVLVNNEDVTPKVDMTREYESQAINFLRDSKSQMIIDRWGYRPDGINICGGFDYKVTIKRNNKTWSFYFTDSIHNKQNHILPTAYDILACLNKYEVEEDFTEFCHEFGYEPLIEDYNYRMVKNKDAVKIHKAVIKEYKNVIRMFGDVLEELSEIQ